MTTDYIFSEDDMVVDEGVGYPKAYARICRDRGVGLYTHGPPFCFRPYSLQPDEVGLFFVWIDRKCKKMEIPIWFSFSWESWFLLSFKVFSFLFFSLGQQTENDMMFLQALRAKELEKMFPIIDPKAKPTNKPKVFLSLLWKQLNHLG